MLRWSTIFWNRSELLHQSLDKIDYSDVFLRLKVRKSDNYVTGKISNFMIIIYGYKLQKSLRAGFGLEKVIVVLGLETSTSTKFDFDLVALVFLPGAYKNCNWMKFSNFQQYIFQDKAEVGNVCFFNVRCKLVN